MSINNLLSTNRSSWRQERSESPIRQETTTTRLMDEMFPMKSFSSMGGGDAHVSDMMTSPPRLKSRLFTITRSAIESRTYSQLDFSYASASAISPRANYNSPSSTAVQCECNSSLSIPSNRRGTEIEFGKLGNALKQNGEDKIFNENEDQQMSLYQNAPRLAINGCTSYGSPRTNKPSPPNLLKRRSFHGSLDDLRKASHSQAKGKPTDKNRRKSAPIPMTKARSEMIEVANGLLLDENKHLTATIKNIQKKMVMAKVSFWFATEGLRYREREIQRLDNLKLEKEQQCATRMILHSLLLNSWRNIKRELNGKLEDNHELKKSNDSLQLQVNVLRHIQSSERQKSKEKIVLIDGLKEKIDTVSDQNRILSKEIDKMESKLNSLQAKAQNFAVENEELSKQIEDLTEKRDDLIEQLKRERVRSEQFGKDNETMKETLNHLQSQLKEVSDQRTQWVEKARAFEAENWKLQSQLKTKVTCINDLSEECDKIQEQKAALINEQMDLKSNLSRTTTALRTLNEKTDELVESYEKVKTERDIKATTIKELEMDLDVKKKQYYDLERELLEYKLQNVRRRRDWGNALYFMVSPVDAFRQKWSCNQ